MKQTLMIVLCVLFMISLDGQDFEQIDVPAGEAVGGNSCNDPDFDPLRNYTTYFVDNFTSGPLVNSSNWSTTYDSPAPWDRIICQGSAGLERQLYKDDIPNQVPYNPAADCFHFENGKLKIRANHFTNTYSGTAGVFSGCGIQANAPFTITREYNSGMLRFNESFRYGKLELRCRIPKAKAAFPAFWLKDDGDEEVDIFEFFNSFQDNKRHCSNIHLWDRNPKESNSYCYNGPDFSTSFHVFGFERTPDVMRWYLDGVQKREIWRFKKLDGTPVSCGTINNTSNTVTYLENKWYNHVPLQILINLAVHPGHQDDPAHYPADFELDYFKIKHRDGSCIDNLKIIGDDEGCTDTPNAYIMDLDGSTSHQWEITDPLNNTTVVNGTSTSISFSISGQYNLQASAFDICNNQTVYEYLTVDVDNNCGGGPLRVMPTNPVSGKYSTTMIDQSQALKSLISIYPNPAVDQLFIDLRSVDNIKNVTMFNQLGEKMEAFNKLDPEILELNLKSYPSGIYLVKIETDSGTVTQKISLTR